MKMNRVNDENDVMNRVNDENDVDMDEPLAVKDISLQNESSHNVINSHVDTIKENEPFKKKHRKQKFTEKWLHQSEFNVSRDPNDKYKAKCIYCCYSMNADLIVIKRHGQSARHIQKMQAATVKQRSISSFTDKKQSVDKATMSSEIKLVGFLMEHNLPFRLTDDLVNLFKDICHDHPVVKNITMRRTKATSIAVNVIGASHKEELTQILRNTKFSLLTDESTDISCIKTACVVVRFNYTISKKIVSEFWELYKVFDSTNANQGATAENLFKGIIKTLEDNSVPLSNMIGFAADGCNAMMGQHNSVASRLKEKCPGIFILKCICHSAHLCASEACKSLPRSVEDLARNIYNFFKSSAKRQCQFHQFQEFVNVVPHKILHPSQTRWLSLMMVIERIIEQWEALRLFFADRWLLERLQATEQIFNELNNQITKLYFFFLQWILPKFTDFNRFFQTNAAVITELHDKIVNLYQEILLCYMNRDYVMKTALADINPCKEEEFIPYSQIYLGIKVLQVINDKNVVIEQKQKDEFLWRCREFLKISALQISNRYNMQDPVLSKLAALRPQNAMSLSYRDTTPTLINLMKVVPRVFDINDNNSDNTMQLVDDQWRRLPLSAAVLSKSIEKTFADNFWNNVLEIKDATGKLQFCKLATFALDVLSLPHSNADCERIFSQVNLIKTSYRNKLNIETVNGALLAAECVKRSQQKEKFGCVSFQPTKRMLERMTSSILYPQKTKERKLQDEESETEIW